MALILVVDDEPILLQVLVESLTDEGFTVHAARDGREAVDLALAEPPDLVLMDITMPRMDGPEAVRQLRQEARLRATPIVLMSAGTRVVRVDSDVTFLPKPFDLDHLLSLVARLLTQRSGIG